MGLELHWNHLLCIQRVTTTFEGWAEHLWAILVFQSSEGSNGFPHHYHPPMKKESPFCSKLRVSEGLCLYLFLLIQIQYNVRYIVISQQIFIQWVNFYTGKINTNKEKWTNCTCTKQQIVKKQIQLEPHISKEMKYSLAL